MLSEAPDNAIGKYGRCAVCQHVEAIVAFVVPPPVPVDTRTPEQIEAQRLADLTLQDEIRARRNDRPRIVLQPPIVVLVYSWLYMVCSVLGLLVIFATCAILWDKLIIQPDGQFGSGLVPAVILLVSCLIGFRIGVGLKRCERMTVYALSFFAVLALAGCVVLTFIEMPTNQQLPVDPAVLMGFTLLFYLPPLVSAYREFDRFY